MENSKQLHLNTLPLLSTSTDILSKLKSRRYSRSCPEAGPLFLRAMMRQSLKSSTMRLATLGKDSECDCLKQQNQGARPSFSSRQQHARFQDTAALRLKGIPTAFVSKSLTQVISHLDDLLSPGSPYPLFKHAELMETFCVGFGFVDKAIRMFKLISP